MESTNAGNKKILDTLKGITEELDLENKKEKGVLSKFLSKVFPIKPKKFDPDRAKQMVNNLGTMIYEQKEITEMDNNEIQSIVSQLKDEISSLDESLNETKDSLEKDPDNVELQSELYDLKNKKLMSEQAIDSFDIIYRNNKNILNKFDEINSIVLPVIFMESIKYSALISQREKIDTIESLKENTDALISLTADMNLENSKDISNKTMKKMVDSKTISERGNKIKENISLLDKNNSELREYIEKALEEQSKLFGD